jgi:TatD DNase family protein
VSQAPRFIDSHCHLDFPELVGELGGVLQRADAAGVGLMLTIGTKLSQFPGVLAIAAEHAQVYCSVGIHPHEAEAETLSGADELVRLAQHPKVVGIGETGLDFHYDHSPRDLQERNFRSHIAAARATGLPLIVHSRNADKEMAAILRQEIAEGPLTGVMHCFSSSRQLAEDALEIGFYISLSGIVTFKNAEDLRQTARAVPMERLLLETDAPYLAPIPKRGQRNEPAYLAHTAAKVAELKGVPVAELARVTSANFHNLFRKIPAPR